MVYWRVVPRRMGAGKQDRVRKGAKQGCGLIWRLVLARSIRAPTPLTTWLSNGNRELKAKFCSYFT